MRMARKLKMMIQKNRLINSKKTKTTIMIKKHLIVLSLSLFIGMTTFAQKSELKAADKALKKKNYAAALSAISQAENLITNADAKTKSKFFYIKGMALYGNGNNAVNNEMAAKAFSILLDLEENGSGTKYSSVAGQTLNNIINSINEESSKSFNLAISTSDTKDFQKAAEGYYKVYQLSPRDTSTLFSAATAFYYAKKHETSIKHFQKLLDLGFTGEMVTYVGESVINGKKIGYSTKKEMDNNVRLGVITNAVVAKSPSRLKDIYKYIALNNVDLGENEKALESMAQARKLSPNDYNIIIDEANVYYKMGDNIKYAEKIEEALLIEPNNAQLHYNVGTLSMDIDSEKAKTHLLKAIELKPDYAEAYGNMGNLILNRKDAVEKEMDANAMNFAKYDQIKVAKWLPILKESLTYLEKSYELSPTESGKIQLNSLYENLDMEKRVE